MPQGEWSHFSRVDVVAAFKPRQVHPGHAYASVLLDAGESIKALSEYLGHSDPDFTLRTYTHLLPSGETLTRKAIDDAFAEESVPGAQGTSVAPGKTNVPSKCPCRLNAPPGT